MNVIARQLVADAAGSGVQYGPDLSALVQRQFSKVIPAAQRAELRDRLLLLFF